MNDGLSIAESVLGIAASIVAVVGGVYTLLGWLKSLRIARDANEEAQSESDDCTDNVRKSQRNYCKYKINSEETLYNKCRLVLAVVKHYCGKNPKCTAKGLKHVFPNSWQGKYIIATMAEKSVIGERKFEHDFFVKDNELITLANGDVVAVCRQWGIDNINKFIDGAIMLGYQISPVNI